MPASLLDGKLVSSIIRQDIKLHVAERKAHGQQPPGLAVILIGTDHASKIYVENKRKACLEVGFNSYAFDLPDTTTQDELRSLIDQLNADKSVHGILIQLPLPPHINTTDILEHINPIKDVDGFHPYNIGRLAQGNPLLRPCTPYGIMQLLDHYKLSVKGKHAVVIGASNIVGRPMALELLLSKATVTICHRYTRQLESHVHMADLLIVATGVADVIHTQWLHEEQIIVDVGIHRGLDGTLRGDVDFALAKQKVAWITPVPGGVGPMTIATLLKNTLDAANHSIR